MPKSRKPQTLALTLLPLLLLTTACTTTPKPTVTIAPSKPDCVNWRDIAYSLHTPRVPAVDDTELTVRDIQANNAARATACNQK